MFYWIYNYPAARIGTLFAVVFVLLTWASILLFRRYFQTWFHTERRANDMVGFVFSSYSVLYGILLGLIAVAAYQNLDNMSGLVTSEASSLAAMYRDLHGYPEPIRGRLQAELRDYTRNEIERDWPELQRGLVPTEGSHRLEQFLDDLLAFSPTDGKEQVVHAEALRQVNTFMNLRRSRLNSITNGIPSVMWWVVGISAVIGMFLIAMLNMEIHVHLILGAAMAVFLGLVIFLIAEMDYPFRGQVSVAPDAFRSVYETLMLPNDAVNASMADLIARTGKLGEPSLRGSEPVAGKEVPALYFGSTKMNNNFEVVDQVVAKTGGTASLFVKSGDEYVRVATNVKKNDGTRAIGTILDPNGPAIARIRRGEAFYGEATILGTPYITGYEPIKDPSGDVIGIYYAGYIRPPAATRQ